MDVLKWVKWSNMLAYRFRYLLAPVQKDFDDLIVVLV